MTDQSMSFETSLEAQARLFCERNAGSEQKTKRFIVLDLEYEYDRSRYDAYHVAEGKGAEDSIRWAFHRIRAASWLPITFQVGKAEVEFGKSVTLTGDNRHETEIVEALFAQLNTLPDAAVATWGGECKDIPVLRRTAAEFGLVLPASLRDLHPFARSRIDLCNEVAGRAANVHLPEYAAATSIPAKPSPSKDIGELVCQGKWDLVEEQCRADVLTTAIILLRHLQSRAEIEVDMVQTLEALIAAALEAAPRSAFVDRTLRLWVKGIVARSKLRGLVPEMPA